MIALPQEHGKKLMSHRVLVKPHNRIVEEPEQRRKAFKTKCKVQGKFCKFVIDGGSIENLVSTEVMDKLKLKSLFHPNPYKVSWLQKGQSVVVTKKCLLIFKSTTFRSKYCVMWLTWTHATYFWEGRGCLTGKFTMMVKKIHMSL